MKRILLLVAFVATSIFARAAYLENVPTTLLQPNGDTLFCLQTGDEVYHRLHDDLGFTILQDPATGFYVYARRGEDGRLVSSGVVAHSFPQGRRLREMGIEPGLMPPADELRARAKGFNIPEQYRKPEAKSSNRNRGTLNNLVIFIRFADEANMGCTFNQVEPMFNDSSAASTSQYAYFRQASYGQLSIVSHFYPQPQGTTVLSYQDSMPRAYYSPYNATTNPIGYTDRYDGRERAMIQRCINWLNANNVVPSSLNLDFDNDGYIDNIVFIVSGTYTGWSDILWPHKWSLYDRYCYINGKRVYTFNLQLAGSGSHYFSSSTLCHEMFHTLGAPDLYRYYDNSGVSTAGSWDLMHSNSTPPQHMSSWMKLQYGNWLDSIQEITAPGTYTLSSLADQSSLHHRAYAIQSQQPGQYWILEYRNSSNRFETSLPGSGLLVWRADTRYDGDASFDTTQYLDGLYLMRPGGTDMVTGGNVNQAHFGQHVGRATFGPTGAPLPWTNPAQPCATCLGTADTTILITGITRSPDGSTLTFTYSDLRACTAPVGLACAHSTNTSALLTWVGRGAAFEVQHRPAGSTAATSLTATTGRVTVNGLQANTPYEFRVRTLCSPGDTSGWSPWQPFATLLCPNPAADTLGSGDNDSYHLPVNTYYRYSLTQQIILASEIGGPRQLTAVEFLYDYATPVTSKTNCTIYLGHTTLSAWPSTGAAARQQAIPSHLLTPVYTGPMNCTQGWNRFPFSTPFDYDDSQNLIIVVDDNSGTYNTSAHTFATQSTPARMSFSIYSDSFDPDADSPNGSSLGTTHLEMARAAMRLVGCDATPQHLITATPNDPALGSAEGGGAYLRGHHATLTATPAPHCHFIAWTGPQGFRSTSNPLALTVQGDAAYTAHFGLDTLLLTASCPAGDALPRGTGPYPYGATATLHYLSSGSHLCLDHWQGPADTLLYDDTLRITMRADADYRLFMRVKEFTIDVLAADPAHGSATGGGRYSYFDTVTLTALPAEGHLFSHWTTSLSNTRIAINPYTFPPRADATFTAHFLSTEGLTPAGEEPLVVIAQGLSIRIQGAQGQSLVVSDLLGRVHHRSARYDGSPIPLPAPGVYLLSAGSRPAQKITVK